MPFPIGFATGAGIPTNEEMDAAAAFGAKFIRCGIPWDSGSLGPDRNFNKQIPIKNAIAYANSIGLGVILQVGLGPTYNGMLFTHSGPGGFDVLSEFAGFCANVCRAFTGTNPSDPNYVWAVEIGNECNHAKVNDPFLDDGVTANPYFVHWTGSAPTGPSRYAELFLRVVHPDYEDVRATTGCPTIITTGLGGESDAKGINSYDFTVAIHQNVTFNGNTYIGGLWGLGGPWFDGYDLHPYCYPTLPSNDTTGGWANMESIMSWFQTNRGEKPRLWITEFGHPTNPETLASCLASRDSLQNAVTDLNAKVAAGWDIQCFAWFTIMNNNKVGGGNDNFFGIVDRPVLGGTDPQNGPHKPGPPTVPSGTGQLFNKFVELATAVDFVVPNSIPTSAPGAPLARSVTPDLVNFFATIPKLTGGRVLFQPNRVYHVEKEVNLDGYKNLTIDGRGATVQANLAAPFAATVGTNGVVTGCTIGAPKWVYGTGGNTTIKTITAPVGTTPFGGIVATTYLSWYIKSTAPNTSVDGRSQGAKVIPGQPDVPGPTTSVIHIINATADAPADGVYTLKFTSPEDRNRCEFTFDNCKNIKVMNLNVVGANPTFAGFQAELEQQSGLWFRGGCDGVEVTGCEIHHNWGDCISLTVGSGIPIKNASIHDNELHHSTRQTMAIGGLIDAEIVDNNMHDGKRHIIDMEPNGGNQTCQRITFRRNKMDRGNFGAIAISAYGGLPMFIGDIVYDNNTIEGDFNFPVGTNHDQPGSQPRWGPFTITNNTATLPFGTGSSGSPWSNAPAMIKFQYCDGIIIHNNVCKLQPGRLMYAVWCEHCTGIDVSGNHDQTATDTFVTPHHELFTDQHAGTGSFHGGGTFSGSGHSVAGPPSVGSGQFHGGGTFTGIGHGRNKGTAAFHGGGTFTGSGRGVNYGTGAFHGGGTFSGTGHGRGFGSGTFKGGGSFSGSGKGVNYGTGTFHGGGTFAGMGASPSFGTGTFHGGGTFSGVGLAQGDGSGTFHGGGTFSGTGHGVGGDDDGDRYQDGEWLTGAVKLRGPGWDDQPWDTGPWDGEE